MCKFDSPHCRIVAIWLNWLEQHTTHRRCLKSQKIWQNHKNTSIIQAFFLKCSYNTSTRIKYEQLGHTGPFVKFFQCIAFREIHHTISWSISSPKYSYCGAIYEKTLICNTGNWLLRVLTKLKFFISNSLLREICQLIFTDWTRCCRTPAWP